MLRLLEVLAAPDLLILLPLPKPHLVPLPKERPWTVLVPGAAGDKVVQFTAGR